MRTRTRQAALCILRRGHSFLVAQVTDPHTGRVYHRPPGGGLEANESPEHAVRREIQEELGITLTEVESLGALDHIWLWKGYEVHERAWLFLADSSKHASLNKGQTPEILEADGDRFTTYWRSIHTVNNFLRQYAQLPSLSSCGPFSSRPCDIVFIEPLLAPNPLNLCRTSCLKRTIQAR